MCGKEIRIKKRTKTQEQFIKEIKSKHNNFYDYSKVIYTKSDKNIRITCPKHGDFTQRANCHLRGAGCIKCVRERISNKLSHTTEQFLKNVEKIKKSKKYDFSKVDYKNSQTDVIVVCPQHGEFKQNPRRILCGHICKKCGYENIGKLLSSNTNQFIEKAIKIHGEKYDYSTVDYKTNSVKVKIRCKKHNHTFEQKPSNHLTGQGCPVCGIEQYSESNRYTTEEFIEMAKTKHGDYYDYSKVDYTLGTIPVVIICPKHGDFQQRPRDHLREHGCRKCAIEKNALSHRKTKEQFIKDAIAKHGNKYDYSKVDHKNCHTKVIIICPKHGEFKQDPTSHIHAGCGCNACGNEQIALSQRKTQDQFIKDCITRHGNTYDYSKVIYEGAHKKIIIICKKHGEFSQSAGCHISGTRCPKCQLKIQTFIWEQLKIIFKSYKIEWENKTIMDDGKKFDIVIPELNLIVEVDGMHHFITNVGKRGYNGTTMTKEYLTKNLNTDIFKMKVSLKKGYSMVRLTWEEGDKMYKKNKLFKQFINLIHSYKSPQIKYYKNNPFYDMHKLCMTHLLIIKSN